MDANPVEPSSVSRWQAGPQSDRRLHGFALFSVLASYREMKERGIPIKMTFNHGVQLSFYFDDLESHMIEIYWTTYVRVPDDFTVRPIDLDQPEEEVMREVERMAEQYGRRTPATAN